MSPFRDEQHYQELREQLVRTALIGRGIDDERVLEAFRHVPRHKFVDPELRDRAYLDAPLPIGRGQVITQPSLVAQMTVAADVSPSDKVLEIGTGSGYQAAILAELAGKVYTIERFESFAEEAAERLEALGYANVEVIVGDGSQGLPEEAPFDAIVVTAGAAHQVPQPLLDQLKQGGRLVIPVGGRESQMVYRYTKTAGGEIQREALTGARFVPLVGELGWEE